MTGVEVAEFLEAGDGQKALQILEDHKVDLVMADLNMPIMGGIEMTDKIMANENTCDVPVVVISTESSSTRIEQLRAKGIKGYIHKPFSPEMVRKLLNSVLGVCNV